MILANICQIPITADNELKQINFYPTFQKVTIAIKILKRAKYITVTIRNNENQVFPIQLTARQFMTPLIKFNTQQ